SDSNGKVSPSRARNFASFSGESGESPTTSYPAARRELSESRKSHAWVVQPGVIAAGYAYRMTLRPRWAASENSSPWSVRSVKSGAGSPGLSRAAVMLPSLAEGRLAETDRYRYRDRRHGDSEGHSRHGRHLADPRGAVRGARVPARGRVGRVPARCRAGDPGARARDAARQRPGRRGGDQHPSERGHVDLQRAGGAGA